MHTIILIAVNDSLREVLLFENYDLTNVVTPVKSDILEQLLIDTGYDRTKSNFVVNGFRRGFPLGYQGSRDIQLTAPNLKLHVGDEIELWNKVMKEVKMLRFAGPYSKIPYKSFIQSPIGLVPKDGGQSTRLIFHLSYPKCRNSSSVNANTPKHLCTVKCPDFTDAVKLCMEIGAGRRVFISKSDVSAAFRNLGIIKSMWRFLLMKARSPKDGKWYYFVEKCLSFGAAISCHNFQEVSDAVAHIVKTRINQGLVNYLDDYFFVALLEHLCNGHMRCFIEICNKIGLPISPEKTLWVSTLMAFLGFLIDTVNCRILVPCEKIARGLNMINYILDLCDKKPAAQNNYSTAPKNLWVPQFFGTSNFTR